MKTRADLGRRSAADIGRALAIGLVICGHTLIPWIAGPLPFHETAFQGWKWGCAFMMPLFFFFSGAIWRASKSLAFTLRESLTLIALAVVVSVLWDATLFLATIAHLSAALGLPETSAKKFMFDTLYVIFYGNYFQADSVWFLTALGVARLATALILRAPPQLHLLLIAALIAVGLLAYSLHWRNIYQMQSVGIAAACIYAGYVCRDAIKFLEAKPGLTLLAAAASAVALWSTYALNNGCMWSPNESCGNPWYGGRFAVLMSHGNVGNLFWFLITSVSGVAFGLTISVLLSRFGGAVAARLAVIGRHSLGLCIVHALFIGIIVGLIPLVAPARPSMLTLIGIVAIGVLLNLALYALFRSPARAMQQSLRSIADWIVIAAQRVGALRAS